MPSQFKDRLAAVMRERNILQKELADRMHVSPPTVSRWLSGENEVHLRDRVALANTLGIVDRQWFLDGVGGPEEEEGQELGSSVALSAPPEEPEPNRVREGETTYPTTNLPGKAGEGLRVGDDARITGASSNPNPKPMPTAYLPPPTAAERQLIIITRNMPAKGVAQMLADVLADTEIPAHERSVSALRLMNILSEKIQKESPPGGRHS